MARRGTGSVSARLQIQHGNGKLTKALPKGRTSSGRGIECRWLQRPKNIYNKIAKIRLGTWNYFCAVTVEKSTDVLVAVEVTVVKVDLV